MGEYADSSVGPRSVREKEFAEHCGQMQEMLQKRETEWVETVFGLRKAEQERINIEDEMSKALEQKAALEAERIEREEQWQKQKQEMEKSNRNAENQKNCMAAELAELQKQATGDWGKAVEAAVKHKELVTEHNWQQAEWEEKQASWKAVDVEQQRKAEKQNKINKS